MGDSEELRYLIRLLPEYIRIGGERYILFRMNRVADVDSWAGAMFCRRCLHLYIPVVNSRMRCSDEVLTIECYGCGGRSMFDRNAFEPAQDPSQHGESEAFEYYFV
ncbi:hypothetical protein M970_030580 [Encephalitozoon cuniculi EcunIII-L]|nr:hypothetical protein M970_030580 [Encephalitozoon cuniculi EcunIII-L]UYI28055.1 hypothetical protein J0A71_09g19510 [Encephalitozoon cuniculi]